MDSEFRILRARTSKVRREEVDGDEFLVVPMVALRTGVYQCANCAEPEFYDAEVFARIPESWNDRPTTLGHPMREGLFVSAGSDDVWRKEGLGRIRNARRDGDKLVLEAWIDLTKADEVGEPATALVDALEDGDGVDVSVGAFVDTVHRPGMHRGRQYARTQLGYVPDHVAFLPGQDGACSWADGCGAPRVNEAIKGNLMTLQKGQSATLENSGGSCDCGGHEGACSCEDPPGKVEILAGSLDFKDSKMSDEARARILRDALAIKLGDDEWRSLLSVFDDRIVYQNRRGTFSRDYTISEDGTVALAEDEVQGALVAEFLPITVQQESEMSERAKAVERLIANADNEWGEGDRDALLAMPPKTFERFAANEVEDAGDKGDDTPSASEDGGDEAPAAPAESEAAVSQALTPEQWLAAAPAGYGEIVQEALVERKTARAELIEALLKHPSNTFSANALKDMETPTLKQIAANTGIGREPRHELFRDDLNFAGAMPAMNSHGIPDDGGFMPLPEPKSVN